jgi:hypothetical protein
VRNLASHPNNTVASTAWLLVAALLAGCSGGGGARPTPAAASAAPMGHAQATITIHRSAAASNARRPAFISPSTQSVAISVYSVDGSGSISANPVTTADADLTPQSPGCTGTGTVVCTVSVPAPPGTDAFGVQLYSGIGESGSLLGSLAPTVTTERTIVAGQNNAELPLVVGGVPANVTISGNVTRLTQGSPATIPLTIVATDAAGNVIVGSDGYANAIALNDSDSSGALTFSANTVTSPATAVVLSYSGGALDGPPTIGGSAPNAAVTGYSLQYVSGSLTLTCSSGCSGLTNGPQPYPLTVSEAGYDAQPFTLSVSGSGCTIGPVGSVQASNGSAVANVYGPPAGGTCNVSVTDIGSNVITASAGFAAAGNPTVVNTCGDSLPKPPDPNGGFLYSDVGCGNVGVQYGSYLFVPLDSNYNPESFQVAAYANPDQTALTQFTVGGNRYINSVAISPPNVVFYGQNGASYVPFTSLVP